MLFEFGATIGTMKEAAEKSILPTRRVPEIGMSTRQSPVREVLGYCQSELSKLAENEGPESLCRRIAPDGSLPSISQARRFFRST
jgi:hypothetical protein